MPAAPAPTNPDIVRRATAFVLTVVAVAVGGYLLWVHPVEHVRATTPSDSPVEVVRTY